MKTLKLLIAALCFSATLSFAADAPPAASADATVPNGQRVFVTAHSFHIFVADILGVLAKSAGITDHKLIGRQMIGGSRVKQHWDLPDDKNKAKEALKAGGIDVLTVSPTFTLPDEGIDLFTDLLLEHSPNARVVVQASWSGYDGHRPPEVFANADRDKATFEQLRDIRKPWDEALEKQINTLNEKYKAKYGRQILYITPAGAAVNALRAKVIAGEAPGIKKQSDLFRDPIGHGNPPVLLLVTYCNFATIYKRSPIGLPCPEAYRANISDKLNTLLQQLAWDAVTSYPLSGVSVPAVEKK